MVADAAHNVDVLFIEFLAEQRDIAAAVNWDTVSAIAEGQRNDYHTLWDLGAMTASDLADGIARYHRLPRVGRDEIADRPNFLSGMSRRFLRDAWLYPYDNDGQAVLAVADPTRSESIREVRLALGRPVEIRVAAFEEIQSLFAMEGDESGLTAETADEDAFGEGDLTLDDNLEALQDLAHGAPIVRAVDSLLEKALEVQATDIHVEPSRQDLRVRFRVDGFLRDEQAMPTRVARAVISRIKIMAGLNIAERRLPQDGRARVRVGNTEADLRIATMPTMHGEAAVMRILVKESKVLDLNRLGLSPRDNEAFRTQLAEPYGLVVVSGPTGSGKTTTLAAALSLLNDPKRKIMTIEDPVEYQVPGVHQTQIKPGIGLTFATALRSFLRHDPDVIMVGEMRDTETARIGIQAALTGHLVLTTLHTNNAVDAVARLMDMGVESFLLASAIRCVVGQRLVRQLCERCRQPEDDIETLLQDLPSDTSVANLAGATLYKAGGCDWCGGTGYRGRIGIFEVMKFDTDLRRHIHHDVDQVELSRLARAAGMTSMLDDGLRKCADGQTTVEEVLRVTI